MGRIQRINQLLKGYDYKLFCERNSEGKICVFRKCVTPESYHLDDNSSIIWLRPTPYFVFALTHNWKESGYSVDWGLEPIMAKLKRIDLWNRDLASDIIANEERISASQDGDRRNSIENFLYDFRDQFKETFKDTNTSSLTKIDKKKERETKYGNFK